MLAIQSYPTPQAFLDATESHLLQKELENNLTIGLCYKFDDRSEVQDNCVFINVFEDGVWQACAIKTWVKAVISGNTQKEAHIKALAAYYLENKVELKGAVGEGRYARLFAKHFGKPQIAERGLIAHQLNTLNAVRLAPGKLEKAMENDIELVYQWSMQFEEDAHTFPKQSAERIYANSINLIQQGNVFKWMANGEPVSMAAIVRKTKNLGIVGLVYTPAALRGCGYATCVVHGLSEHILKSGFKYCGLFTDKENPTSNHIYQKTGYEARSEFSDIEFGE